MGLSAYEKPAAEFDVLAFLELAQDPKRYKEILDRIAEMKASHAALDRRTAELEIREHAAAALAAEAGRVRSTYEARAANLKAVLESLK